MKKRTYSKYMSLHNLAVHAFSSPVISHEFPVKRFDGFSNHLYFGWIRSSEWCAIVRRRKANRNRSWGQLRNSKPCKSRAVLAACSKSSLSVTEFSILRQESAGSEQLVHKLVTATNERNNPFHRCMYLSATWILLKICSYIKPMEVPKS
jgi:hypothetical protein